MAGSPTGKGLYMASRLYKNYLIVSAADYNRDTLEWKPWASICWRDNGHQHLHQIRFTNDKFQTAEEAEKVAMKAGEIWIDGQLGV